MAMNTGKIQGKHREFNLNLNVATLDSHLKAKCSDHNGQKIIQHICCC